MWIWFTCQSRKLWGVWFVVLNISDWLSTHCILVHLSCLAHSYKLTVDVIVIEFTSISFPADQQKPINFSLSVSPNSRNDQDNFPLQRRKTKINSRVAHYLQGCVYTAAEAHSGLWPLHLHTPQQPNEILLVQWREAHPLIKAQRGRLELLKVLSSKHRPSALFPVICPAETEAF